MCELWVQRVCVERLSGYSALGEPVVYLFIALMIPKLEFTVWDGFN
jgi:hypothetical protein